jgi:hypothetical protein
MCYKVSPEFKNVDCTETECACYKYCNSDDDCPKSMPKCSEIQIKDYVGICVDYMYDRYEFFGRVNKGEEYQHQFSDDYIFILSPLKSGMGWEIVIQEKNALNEYNLARLTPPLHLTLNPRYIEGWHFRNADNSDQNDGSVNAPQEVREFIFSSKVGKSIALDHWPTLEDIEIIEKDGKGELIITKMELGNFKKGEKAYIESMSFQVSIQLKK